MSKTCLKHAKQLIEFFEYQICCPRSFFVCVVLSVCFSYSCFLCVWFCLSFCPCSFLFCAVLFVFVSVLCCVVHMFDRVFLFVLFCLSFFFRVRFLFYFRVCVCVCRVVYLFVHLRFLSVIVSVILSVFDFIVLLCLYVCQFSVLFYGKWLCLSLYPCSLVVLFCLCFCPRSTAGCFLLDFLVISAFRGQLSGAFCGTCWKFLPSEVNCQVLFAGFLVISAFRGQLPGAFCGTFW